MTAATQLLHNPSIASFYVTDAFYRDLIASFTDWQDDARLVTDMAERDRFRGLVEREARLLDQLRLHDWLAMYCPECVCWVPTTTDAGDPRREVSISFDDRRRMEDRVYRLETGYAWSQAPKSRTVRMITNVEVFEARPGVGDALESAPSPKVRMVRSNLLISEFRVDGIRTLAGWCGHRFVEVDGQWQIQVRQVNLIDCDQNLRNPSIVI